MAARSSARWLVPLLLVLAGSPAAWASGSYGGNSGGGYRGGDVFSPGSRTDALYERGKALSRGRVRAHRGVELCIVEAEGAEPREIGFRSLSSFRGGQRADLARHLVVCDAPEVSAREKLGESDEAALVHYLERRYRLRLES